MNISFDDLERDGLIRRLPVDEKKVRDAFALAKRDVKTSKGLLAEDPDWAFSIAYNAILQAARALMFSRGYRPHGKAQHISVIRFLETSLGKDAAETIVAIDRMRRKRHRAVYDTAGSVSTLEAENATKRAEDFLKVVETGLKDAGFLE
jgi:uncharacterized protein (UPF0332 family)